LKNKGRRYLSDKRLIVDFLNVGFGDSVFIRTTGVKPLHILVDGGDNRHEMFARHRNRIKLSEYLRVEGTRDIDLMILTHFHRDHIAGIHEAIHGLTVREAWVNYLLPYEFQNRKLDVDGSGISQSIDMYNDIFQVLERSGTRIRFVDEDVEYKTDNGGTTLKITGLTPGKKVLSKLSRDMEMIYSTTDPDVRAEKLQEVDKSLNQTCIVTKIDYLNTGVLLSSDVPLSFWERFISTEALKAVILKAPHHGDIDCVNRELIETVGAKYLVISVDNEGIYDLPSPETKELAESMGLKVVLTEGPIDDCCEHVKQDSGASIVRFTVTCQRITCKHCLTHKA